MAEPTVEVVVPSPIREVEVAFAAGPRGLPGQDAEVTAEAVAAVLPERLSESELSATINVAVMPARQLSQDDSEPVFVRVNDGNPIFSVTAQNPVGGALAPATSATIYWQWVIEAGKYIVGALDDFYMYYSTDHGAGGVWLATAPTPLGPWSGRGRVFAGGVGTPVGTSWETPSVVWVPEESLFFMFYQASAVGNSSQSTLLATSPDGINWTKVGVVLDWLTPTVGGNGHTGYFNPFRIGRQWYAYHLWGGAIRAEGMLSTSSDGRTWTTTLPLRGGVDQVGIGRLIAWNHCHVINWRGQLLLVGFTTNQNSGGIAVKDARLFTAPLAANMRAIIGVPRIQLFPFSSQESANIRSVQAFVWQSRLYLTYLTNGGIFAAVAE